MKPLYFSLIILFVRFSHCGRTQQTRNPTEIQTGHPTRHYVGGGGGVGVGNDAYSAAARSGSVTGMKGKGRMDELGAGDYEVVSKARDSYTVANGGFSSSGITSKRSARHLQSSRHLDRSQVLLDAMAEEATEALEVATAAALAALDADTLAEALRASADAARGAEKAAQVAAAAAYAIAAALPAADRHRGAAANASSAAAAAAVRAAGLAATPEAVARAAADAAAAAASVRWTIVAASAAVRTVRLMQESTAEGWETGDGETAAGRPGASDRLDGDGQRNSDREGDNQIFAG